MVRFLSVLAIPLLLTGIAHAQDITPTQSERYFRIDAQPTTARGGRPVLAGYVYNDHGLRALQVRLTAEALDAGGQVVGRTTGYVNGEIPPSSRAYFEMPVPPNAVSYRVRVSSVFFTQGAGG